MLRRRVLLVLMFALLAALLVAGPALSALRIGTDGPDELIGTHNADQFVGNGGADTL